MQNTSVSYLHCCESFPRRITLISLSYLHHIYITSDSWLSHFWVHRIWVMLSTYPRETCNASASYVRQICNVSESYLRRKFLISTRNLSASYRRISVSFLWLTSSQSFLSLLVIWTDLNARSTVKGSTRVGGKGKNRGDSLSSSSFLSSLALSRSRFSRSIARVQLETDKD